MSTIPLYTHRYFGYRNSCRAEISVFLMVVRDCIITPFHVSVSFYGHYMGVNVLSARTHQSISEYIIYMIVSLVIASSELFP